MAVSTTTIITYCDQASGLKSLTMAKSRRDPEKSWHASAGDQENVRCRQSMLPPTLRWLFQR